MAGMNEVTGQFTDEIEDIYQSVEILMSTHLGERVMREWVGNPGLRLLGENATQQTVLLWFTTLWTVITLFEPRMRIRQFIPNSIDRLGYGDFTMEVELLPYAHLGWQQAQAFVSIDDGTVRVRSAQ